MLKRIVALIMSFIMIFALASCADKDLTAHDSSWNAILKSGKLKVGINNNNPPMSFYDRNQDIDGFDVDLAEALAKKMDLKVEFVAIDWTKREKMLNDGTVDVLWSGYVANPKEILRINFTKPYITNSQKIFVPKDSEITGRRDLRNYKVGVVKNSAAISAVQQDAFGMLMKKNLVQFDTVDDAFNALKNNTVQAVVTDSLKAEYFLTVNEWKDYKGLDDIFSSEDFSIGVKKGNIELWSKIQSQLDALIIDGTADDLCEVWFTSQDIIK